MNLYAYVGNNPFSHSDPTGQWSPAAHDYLIRHALEGRATQSDIRAIQQASRAFDERTQAIELANVHSMTVPGQDPVHALINRDGFIRGTLDLARDAALAGHRDVALDLLSQALHPLMDSSSPAHTDENGLPEVWSLLRWNLLKHRPFDIPLDPVGESTRNITDDILRQQDRLILKAYRYVFAPAGALVSRPSIPRKGRKG